MPASPDLTVPAPPVALQNSDAHYGCIPYDKTNTVVVNGGALTTVEFHVRDSNGAAIDLSYWFPVDVPPEEQKYALGIRFTFADNSVTARRDVMGSVIDPINGQVQFELQIPVDYVGSDYILELDINWLFRVTNHGTSWSSQSHAEVMVSRINDRWPSASTAFFRRGLVSSSANWNTVEDISSRTIRIPVNNTTASIGKNFVYVRVSASNHQRYEVELTGLRAVRENRDRITGGMSGSLTYVSGQSRKIHRIDIVCDSNARARLRNEDFEWQEEDLGHISYWRGVKRILVPVFLTEYTFQFRGTNVSNTLIGDGIIYAVYFYEETQQTEYDLPILVRFAVEVSRNVPEGIFYYTDHGGREHCVAVNEVILTPAELTDILHDPATRTQLNLPVRPAPDRQGTISGTIPGNINTNCLQ